MKSKMQSSDFKIPKGAPPKKSKPTKRPLILLNHLQEEVLEVAIQAQALEEDLEEPPEVNTIPHRRSCPPLLRKCIGH